MTIDLKTPAYVTALATVLALSCAADARAANYVVEVEGSFTTDMGSQGPIQLAPPVSFVGTFDVDTSVSPIEYPTNGGYTMTGYPDAAISNVSMTVFGTSFAASDITDVQFVSTIPGSAVYFSEDLYRWATPSIWMDFYTPGGQQLQIGEAYCGSFSVPSCGIWPYLTYQDWTDPLGDVYLGSVSAEVVPEPAAWTLMLAGLGLAGAGLRARRRSGAVAASGGAVITPTRGLSQQPLKWTPSSSSL